MITQNLQIIDIETPVDQEKFVQYGDRTIEFQFRWNEKTNNWYMNILENGGVIAMGITMALNSNLLYDRMGLGKIYLIDTKYGKTSDPIVKSDFGSRLVLGRVYSGE